MSHEEIVSFKVGIMCFSGNTSQRVNTIINQLLYVEIDFDNEACALILLASLPNNWEPMRAIVSNFLGNAKLKFNDIRDQILVEEVRRIDSSEALIASSTLNLENKGRGNDKNSNQNKGRLKSRNGRSNFKSRQNMEYWNCGKTNHIKKQCRA